MITRREGIVALWFLGLSYITAGSLLVTAHIVSRMHKYFAAVPNGKDLFCQRITFRTLTHTVLSQVLLSSFEIYVIFV